MYKNKKKLLRKLIWINSRNHLKPWISSHGNRGWLQVYDQQLRICLYRKRKTGSNATKKIQPTKTGSKR